MVVKTVPGMIEIHTDGMSTFSLSAAGLEGGIRVKKIRSNVAVKGQTVKLRQKDANGLIVYNAPHDLSIVNDEHFDRTVLDLYLTGSEAVSGTYIFIDYEG